MGQFCGQLSVSLALKWAEMTIALFPLAFVELMSDQCANIFFPMWEGAPRRCSRCSFYLYNVGMVCSEEAKREGACVGEAALRALQGDPSPRRGDGDL